MRFSTSFSGLAAGSLLLLSSFATAVPTTEAGRAAIAPKETSLVGNAYSMAAEPVAVTASAPEMQIDGDLLKRSHPDPNVPPPGSLKEHQKPGIGQGPTLGIDPGFTSGIVITSIVVFIYGSMIWFTTEDDQW